jgi:hypothetical protein
LEGPLSFSKVGRDLHLTILLVVDMFFFVGSCRNFFTFYFFENLCNLKLLTSYNCTDLCFPPILGARQRFHPLQQGEACAHQQSCGRLKPFCGRLDPTPGFRHPVRTTLQHSHAAHARTSGDYVFCYRHNLRSCASTYSNESCSRGVKGDAEGAFISRFEKGG